MQSDPRNRRPHALAQAALLGAVLAGGLISTGCVNREAQAQAQRTREIITDPSVPVVLGDVVLRSLAETRRVTGTIVTQDDASISALAPGRLAAVYVTEGSTVTAGQVVAVQDTRDLMARLSMARSQVDAARAGLDQAKSDATVGPQRSAAAVRASRARVDQAKSALQLLRKGARDEERKQAEAQVNAAKSNVDTAKAGMDRAKRLHSEGALAKSALEQAENAYAQALAGYEAALEGSKIVANFARPEDIAQAESQVRAAEEALRIDLANQKLDVQFRDRVRSAEANLRSAQENVAMAQKALEDANIRAPFSGRIVGRPVPAGTVVSPGVPIARLVSSGDVYFDAQIPETDVASIEVGAPVMVTVDALAGQQFSAKVTAVSPTASSVARLFNLRVTIEGDTASIKPGMFARGEVTIGIRTDVVVVPTSSIVGSGAAAAVFVVEGDQAKRRPVKLGIQSDGMTEVSGVSPGDKLVVSGQTGLVDGVKVELRSTPEEGTNPTAPTVETSVEPAQPSEGKTGE